MEEDAPEVTGPGVAQQEGLPVLEVADSRREHQGTVYNIHTHNPNVDGAAEVPALRGEVLEGHQVAG